LKLILRIRFYKSMHLKEHNWINQELPFSKWNFIFSQWRACVKMRVLCDIPLLFWYKFTDVSEVLSSSIAMLIITALMTHSKCFVLRFSVCVCGGGRGHIAIFPKKYKL
jgi:hypothetical protein